MLVSDPENLEQTFLNNTHAASFILFTIMMFPSLEVFLIRDYYFMATLCFTLLHFKSSSSPLFSLVKQNKSLLLGITFSGKVHVCFKGWHLQKYFIILMM